MSENKELAVSLDRILEARETVKRFIEQGGSCFVDGCSGLADNDILMLAKNMEFLMKKEAK